MESPKLALYHYDSCVYCARVRSAIARLGLEVELRDIHVVPGHRAELVKVSGAQTVPVLVVREPGADERTVRGSERIVRELHQIAGVDAPRADFRWLVLFWGPFVLLGLALVLPGKLKLLAGAAAVALLLARLAWQVAVARRR